MSGKKRSANTNGSETLTHLVGFTFLLLVMAVPVAPGLSDHLLIKASLVEVYVFILTILFLFKFNDGNVHFVRETIPVTLVLFIIWGVLSLFWSAGLDYGVVLLFKWLTGALLAILVFQIRNYAELMKVLSYLFAGCVILSTIGIVQHLAGFDLISQNKPPASTFANRNMAGQIVILSWMLGVYFLTQVTNRQSFVQYYYAIGTSFALAYALYTGSRAVWLAIFIQILLLTVFLAAARIQSVQVINFKRINSKAVLSAVIVLLVLVNFDGDGFKPVWETLGGRIADIGETRVEGPGAFKRFILWGSTFEMIKDNPVIGTGLGGFEASHQQYAVGDTVYSAQAHSDYLQYVAELGVVTLLAVLIIGGMFVFTSIRLITHAGEVHALARYVVLILLAGIAVDAFFSFPLQLIGPIVVVSGLLGIFFRLGYMQVESDSRVSLASAAKPIMLAMVIPLTLVIIWSNFEWHTKLGELNHIAAAEKTRKKLELNMLIEHPTFRRFVWVLTNQYRAKKPRKAEKIAKAYFAVNENDVIVNNTLALTAVLRKDYEEGRIYLKKARDLEAGGNYSSYVTELVMYGQLKDHGGLKSTLDVMESEPREMILVQPYNLVAMALAAYQLEQREHAVELLEENIRAYPVYSPSYERIVQILIQLKRQPEAKEYLQKLEGIAGENQLTQGLRKLVDS